MKKCSVCEGEIRSDLEEFGDPREPVCAGCWLLGKVPGQLPEDQIKRLENEIEENEKYLDDRLYELKNYDPDPEDYELLDEDDIRYIDDLRQDIKGTHARIDKLHGEIKAIRLEMSKTINPIMAQLFV